MLGVLEALEGISSNRMLDRLIRGRLWIGLVAFALIGIVAAQLWVVKLGVGIGRALEHAALLQRENSALAIEDSALSSGERVERLALARGMVLAPPGALHFDALRGPLDARLAAAALARPTSTPTQTTGLVAGASSTTTAGGEGGVSTTTSGEAASTGATEQTSGAEAAAAGTSEAAGATGATTGSNAAGEGAPAETSATSAGAPVAAAPTSTPTTATPAATGGSGEAVSPPAGASTTTGGEAAPGH